jgi:uncharacterized protein with PIN domain
MGAGDVVVRVSGLARATCDDGHVTVVPVDATDALLAAVATQLPTASTRGVLRRREVCHDCGEELVLPPRRSERAVPEDVDGRVVTAHVEASMLRCPACAREQLTARSATAIPSVLAAAVEASAAA